MMHLVGVDPSSTATGITLLTVTGQPEDPIRAQLWAPGPRDVAVLRSWTIRPNAKLAIAARCRRLHLEVFLLADCSELTLNPFLFVIEDPTSATFGGRGAGGAAAKVGAAFGAAYCALADVVDNHAMKGSELRVVPSEKWLPRVRGVRGAHPMKHEQARAWLRLRWPALQECTDDETFAAGVALYAVTRYPMVVAA